MKRYPITRVFLLLLLPVLQITAAGTIRTSIPLKPNDSMPAIRLNNLTVVLVGPDVRPGLREDEPARARLKIKVILPDHEYETALNYREGIAGRAPNNYPLGIGNYLLSLDVRNDSAYVSVDTLKWGDTFALDRKNKKGVTIDGLTVAYAGGYTANLVDENGNYDGYETGDSFKLSENGEEAVISFLRVSAAHAENETHINHWKNYKIELTDHDHNAEYLILKISRE